MTALTDEQLDQIYDKAYEANMPECGCHGAGLRAVAEAAVQDAGGEYPKFCHPDDDAVDRFAAAMKAKMAKQRAKGYGGWDNEVVCPADRLRQMLTDHVAKGDPVDVGNFAMMLWSRNENTHPPQASATVPEDRVFDEWAIKRFPLAARTDSLGGWSRDMQAAAKDGWNACRDAMLVNQKHAQADAGHVAGSRNMAGAVRVCPTRDVECGDRPARWCESCPKKDADKAQGVGK